MTSILGIKIVAALLVLAALVGAVLYVRSVFVARDGLLVDVGKLQTELTVEKFKNAALLKQSEQIATMNNNILEAVKRVKINSTVYIDKVEATPLPVPLAGGTVLVPGGSLGVRMPQTGPSPYLGLPVVNYPVAN